MSLARQAPAGRPVPRTALAVGRSTPPVLWPGLQTSLFDSGTAALAVALERALATVPADAPRCVALPAYACPNLVAAALWARATPEYYDLSRDTLGAEPGVLEKLAARDAVVLNVDAFGADTLPTGVGVGQGPRLVHDLAQSFAPFQDEWRPRAAFTVASFGRAKPLSLTLGGALIATANGHGAGRPTPTAAIPTRAVPDWKLSMRAAVYALSLSPLAFGLLARIPALGIGQTKFAPLTGVTGLPAQWHERLAAAVQDLRQQLSLFRDQTAVMLRLALECGARVPASAVAASDRLPLWRIPVLCPTPEAATGLAREGAYLGISRLYARPLPQIVGMPAEEVEARWPNAAWIAERLITLPAHGRLGQHLQEQLRRLLERRLH
jgi:hypothetical protein